MVKDDGMGNFDDPIPMSAITVAVRTAAHDL